MNWHAVRTRQLQPADRARHAAAVGARAGARPHPDDGEIRAIWKAAENSGTFGAFVRIALLDRATPRKVLGMRWADISESGEWTIPKEPREKDIGRHAGVARHRARHHPGAAAARQKPLRLCRPRR